MNVITKSGSSKVHGTAFWFGQNNDFDAMTRADTAALLTTTPPYYEQKVGGTLGGPLGKKDTFFFMSYQFDRSAHRPFQCFPGDCDGADHHGVNLPSGCRLADSGPGSHALLIRPSKVSPV